MRTLLGPGPAPAPGAYGLAMLLALAACAHGHPRPEDATPGSTTAADQGQALVITSTPSPPGQQATTVTLVTVPDGGKPLSSTPPPQVRSLHVNSNVQYRYAHTVVSSRIANPASKSQEVSFSVVLPETAFISSFAMEVDGKVYKAYVKEKEEAKHTYDQAVAAGQSAAHVAVSARDSNSFTVSVNVEPENKVSFNLTYEELLNRRLGLYNHVVTLNPGQVVDDLLVRVHIKESKKLSKLRVPEFSSGSKGEGSSEGCSDLLPGVSAKCTSGSTTATADWKSPNEVVVLFRPTADTQRQIADKLAKKKAAAAKAQLHARAHHVRFFDDPLDPTENENAVSAQDKGLNGQFAVEYDVERDSSGGEVLLHDGYFVHFFSPSQLKPLSKHAIFVLDVSGSMDGRKIEQLREAMIAILKDLKPQDYFSLVEFSSNVKVWDLDNPGGSPIFESRSVFPMRISDEFPEVTTPKSQQKLPPAYKASEVNIEKAKDIVKRMSAYGGTNIYEALKTGLDLARNGVSEVGSGRPEEIPQPIILFLTDGDPTVGVTMPSRITSAISELNNHPRTAVFSLAFGEGADIKFLRKLSLANGNGGFARNIYEAADASSQLKDFYRGVSSPLLANVTFRYVPDKIDQDSTTQSDFRTFFDGTELVVAGRTTDKGVEELNAEVSAVGEMGNQTYKVKPTGIDLPLTIYPFDEEGPLFNHTVAPRPVSMMERLWAYLTIKQLLDESDAMEATKDQEETYILPPPPPLPPVAMPAQAPPPLSSSTTAPLNSTVTLDADDLGNLTDVFKPNPKKKALQLALKYSFVTPLTSLVVVKPNETRATDAETVRPGDGDRSKFGYVAGLHVSRFGGVGLLNAPAPAFSKASVPQAALLPLPPGATLLTTPAPNGLVTSLGSPAVPHIVEAYDPVVEATTEAESEPAPTSGSALPAMLNISEVAWLPQDALEKSEISLPLGENGTAKNFKLAFNQTEFMPKEPCSSKHTADSPNRVDGVCRYLANCVLSQVVRSVEDFRMYQCSMGDYLAICCPTDADEITTQIPVSSPKTVR